jgi:hypothetical protein
METRLRASLAKMGGLAWIVSAGLFGCQVKVGTGEDGGTGGDSGVTPKGGSPGATGGAASGGTSDGGRAGSFADGGSDPATGGDVASGGRSAAGGQPADSAGTAGISGGRSASLVEDCASTEPENNDTRETAALLGTGATLCVKGSDQDWLYVDTPDDGKAHILELRIAPEPGADVDFKVESSVDGSSAGNDYTTNGADETLWLTLGPASRTLLRFARWSSGGIVKLTATLETEQDPYSPNYTRETAAKIEVNAATTAEMHQPFTSNTDRPYVDWYQAELAAGAHMVSFTHVPSSRRVSLKVVDSRGQNVASGYAANAGALYDLKFNAATAGTYFVSVDDFSSGPGSFSVGQQPAVLSDSYTFSIVE